MLAVPVRRVSGWVAETDANYARAWLAALPMADSAEAAREVYQALFRVNRIDIKAPARLELLSLYAPAVAAIGTALQPQLSHSVPPLTPQKREPAELLRRLHIEMAHGYRRCWHDLRQTRVLLRRKRRSALCIERGLFHLGEVLFLSYLLYLPYPIGVWREIHELYRLAESMGIAEAAIEATDAGEAGAVSITARYVQTLLLGVTNPYQFPHNAVQPMRALLRQWGPQAHLSTPTPIKEATGCFYVDLSSDAPPIPLAKKSAELAEHARILHAADLLATVQRLAARADAGASVERLELGVDCLDNVGTDLLRRLTRALGDVGRRRYARRQHSSDVLVCIGLDALHYFANGRRPFAAYVDACRFLQATSRRVDHADVSSAGSVPDDHARARSARRIGRWRLRDVAPQGMSLARHGDAVPVRVGDLIGIQQIGDVGRWRPAVIRWIKSPETNSLEIGVELLAAAIVPVAVRSKDASARPALRLPDVEALHHPAALVLESASAQVGDEFELMEETADTRRVKLVRLLERTAAFEQFVYELSRG
ncbi:MAG: hypothetical protein ACJ8J7_08860 [Sulfurifustaceae bacterium]